LYLTPHFFQDKPVDRLIGEGIEARHLNDTVLDRALEVIYEHNPEELYPQLAAGAVGRLGLPARFGHLDSTSFHTDGRHPNNESEEEEGVIQIIKNRPQSYSGESQEGFEAFVCLKKRFLA
jgi:hypothetical protein